MRRGDSEGRGCSTKNFVEGALIGVEMRANVGEETQILGKKETMVRRGGSEKKKGDLKRGYI